MAQPPRGKPNKPDTTAPFKTAMAAAVRAVAGKPELEVSFSADRPLLTADKARLANLPRLPTRRDIAIARGQGDAMAMRLASHDPDVHRKRAPAEPEARAAFDALEQARVEALGCLRMPGMTGNIHEMLDDRLFRSNLAEVSSKDDAPLAEVLGLMLREKLAGVSIPPSGHAIVDLWKKEIEQKAGLSLTTLLTRFEDQDLFARAAKLLLRDLNLVPEGDLDDGEGDDESGDEQEPEPGEDA
ncbi:MAG: cobaltochelatase subunit CobT, partial [Devosia sp.]|nr:cobaltochelatase subunit CobT [Devosia sp.]